MQKKTTFFKKNAVFLLGNVKISHILAIRLYVNLKTFPAGREKRTNQTDAPPMRKSSMYILSEPSPCHNPRKSRTAPAARQKRTSATGVKNLRRRARRTAPRRS